MLTPANIKVIVGAVLLLAVASVTGFLGVQIGEANQISVCADEKKVLQSRIDELQLEVARLEKDKSTLLQGLADANHAAALLKAQTDAAAQAQAEAESQVAEIKKSSEKRIEKITKAKQASTGCSDLLSTYWEMRN